MISPITFRPAKTLDGAVRFGQQVLGVQKYTRFRPEDLDVLNYINEGLAVLRNTTKGKVKMPDIINYRRSFTNNFGSCGLTEKGQHRLSIGGGVRMLNKDNEICIKYMLCENIISKNSKGKLKLSEKLIESNGSKELKKLLNASGNLNLKDSFKLYWTLTNIKEAINNKKVKYTVGSTFYNIFHELGHLQHRLKVGGKTFFEMYTLKGYEDSFAKNPKVQKLAGQVSSYAKTNPLEFVAETYKKLINKEKLPKGVMGLYKQFGGVPVKG